MEKEELYGEDRLAAETRIRNLLWTVSGDYDLSCELDIDSFQKAKEISLYDAIKQGAFARFFDTEAFGLYLVKKIYLGADEGQLMGIAQLCLDEASFSKVAAERPGVPDIRKKAFEEILERDFGRLNASFAGRLKLAYLRRALTGDPAGEQKIRRELDLVEALKDTKDTLEIIRCVYGIYNSAVDRKFEREHGTLAEVLAVSVADLKKYDWQDYLKEEAEEARLEEYLRQMQNQLTSLSEEEEQEKEKTRGGVVLLDEEAVEKMYSYMELNYGRSYLNEFEQQRIDQKLCRGAHADCSLYFTDGILAGMVRVNAQSEYARRTKEVNLRFYQQNARVAKQNIQILTDVLHRALMARNERETFVAEYGRILPDRLWNIGRTQNRKLFLRETKRYNTDFVVEVLIDGSGSQRSRQSQIALQAYIISEALTNIHIPHRVMSFCTFWDYTVMRRFREYEEGAEANWRIFEFYGSSNNRDGLAVRAAAAGLLQRAEENRILIVLSDGRPNDIVVNRPNSRNPRAYFGDYGTKDTAMEVRHLRNAGVSVLGVFTGEEQDLLAERRIFGKDFAYIRSIENFSNVVGRYLKKQLED